MSKELVEMKPLRDGTSGYAPDLKWFDSETPYIRKKVIWSPFNELTYAIKVGLGLSTKALFTYLEVTSFHPSGETTYEFRRSTASP